jgi:tetratricopeptide (TPR) repeat protein
MRKNTTWFLFLALSLSASARDTTDHWIEVRSQHFVVLTNSNEKQARHTAGEFERMRGIFHLLMPAAADSAGSPIVVVAVKDKKAFQALEPEAYLGKGMLNLAGLFMRAPDKNYILLRLDAEGDHPFATVYHEYTHYMLRNASEWLPIWLNEGLAEFYQNTDIHDKEILLGQANTDDILYLRQNKLLPLATLFKVDAASPYYHEEQKGSVFYAESWALTHLIEISDAQKNTNRLQDYANRLSKKEDSLVAAQEAFGDLNMLQKALNSYIAQGQFMMFKMSKVVAVDETSFTVRAVSTADADAIRADVLVYTQRTKEAQALIESTLRDDPNNALAHETMGFIKFREGDLPAARKWYGEAVKLDSQSYLAHYYFAAMSLQSGDQKPDPQIESSLRACIKLNPTFAPAYDALARYYANDPAKMQEAHTANMQAIGLEPDNLDYRMNAASVLMNNRRYDDALAVLRASMHVAKNPVQVATVQIRIDQIVEYQASLQQRQHAPQQVAYASPSTFITDTRTNTITSSDGRTYVIKPDSPTAVPKYPTEAPTGPHHTVRGVLHGVKCAYPSILTLSVEQSGKAQPVTLYRNDFNQIDFSAANFTPNSDLNPCTDIEGVKAFVVYAEVSDKSVGGQILSVELSK